MFEVMDMRCPYCNSQVKDGSKFCTECGATLNAAAVQRERELEAATNTGLMLGAAARKARLEAYVSEDQIISARAYNGILLGVLVWGLLINVVLCYTVGDVFRYVNPVVFLIGYAVLAFAGIFIAGRSHKPLVSFLGYNMVVIPFGLVLSITVEAYGGVDSAIVTYAFLYTLVVTLGMTGAALAFPQLFSKLGGALAGVLLGLILCEVLLLLFRIPQSVSDWLVAGLFSLYIGYDVYRSQQFAKTVDNAVDCALDIYMDIANLFIRILRIMGKKKD